jgi:hypothetical protein
MVERGFDRDASHQANTVVLVNFTVVAGHEKHSRSAGSH